MDKLYNLEEAKNWFLSHSSGSVVCVNKLGVEKECNYYFAAEEFYQEPPFEAMKEVGRIKVDATTDTFTREQYEKAIENLQLGMTQLEPDGNNCAICGDTGHQAWECHHNPLNDNYIHTKNANV